MLEPRHRLDCGTWGVMGCGTGYAIGAALSTGKKVLYIGGDSAFGFDGMEVEVACRYQLPITFVVLNNGGIYRGDFENLGADGDPSPLTLTYNAHYEKVLEAFGVKVTMPALRKKSNAWSARRSNQASQASCMCRSRSMRARNPAISER